jgi:hypothetical protein
VPLALDICCLGAKSAHSPKPSLVSPETCPCPEVLSRHRDPLHRPQLTCPQQRANGHAGTHGRQERIPAVHRAGQSEQPTREIGGRRPPVMYETARPVRLDRKTLAASKLPADSDTLAACATRVTVPAGRRSAGRLTLPLLPRPGPASAATRAAALSPAVQATDAMTARCSCPATATAGLDGRRRIKARPRRARPGCPGTARRRRTPLSARVRSAASRPRQASRRRCTRPVSSRPGTAAARPGAAPPQAAQTSPAGHGPACSPRMEAPTAATPTTAPTTGSTTSRATRRWRSATRRRT